MTDGGKGSKPRPFSVTQDEYDNRWNAIFQRDDVVSKSEAKRLATMQMADELEEYKKQAQDLWSDSCTTPRSK
jgi:hypothetical protein